MKMIIGYVGLREKIRQLQTIKTGIPAELEAGMREAGQPLMDATQYYPPAQGSYVRGGPRSERYGATQTFEVYRAGNATIGQATMKASYSIYLRGTPDGSYRGAWMHLGIWESLIDIITRVSPKVFRILVDRVESYISRIMG